MPSPFGLAHPHLQNCEGAPLSGGRDFAEGAKLRILGVGSMILNCPKAIRRALFEVTGGAKPEEVLR